MFCSKRNTDLSRSSTRTTDCQHQTISQNKELTIQESRKKNTKHTIHQMNTIMHQLSSYKTSEPRCNEKGDKVSVLSTETQFTHYISHLNQTANVAKYSRSSKTKGSWWNKVGCRFLQVSLSLSLSSFFLRYAGDRKSFYYHHKPGDAKTQRAAALTPILSRQLEYFLGGTHNS